MQPDVEEEVNAHIVHSLAAGVFLAVPSGLKEFEIIS